MNIDEAKSKLRRRAIVLEVGGFRPADSADASWFGRVNLAGHGEAWPESNGKPMHALCQINLTEMPFRPPRLEDIDFIAVFIGPDDLPNDVPNGTNWCLRAYSSLDELTPLKPVETGSRVKTFPIRPSVVAEDFPMWEDVNIKLTEELEEQYYDLFDNAGGLKLGGWPSLIQSEIYWAPFNRHPALPEYVFQVDSNKKGNWMWGDNGVGYFGRGTTPGHENEWACEWQCY